jgi:Domain of unknown function (DUF4419)
MKPYDPLNGYVKEGREGGWYEDFAPHDVQGPDCANFPTGIAAVPVEWDFHGQIIDLTFKAGFFGATQDIETGTIRPVVGWLIQREEKEGS